MGFLNKGIIFLFLLIFSKISAQERVEFNDIYFQNNSSYKFSNNNLFTGIAEKRRANGHLVYEEDFVDGQLTKSTLYYNGRGDTIPATEKLYYENSSVLKTKINYGLQNSIIEYIHFDERGQKILSEIYKDKELTYRCEFLNNKKNGKEFCIGKDGTEMIIDYRNGKKLK